VPDISDGPVLVVSQGFNQNSNPVWTIALIHQFFEVIAVRRTSAALYGAINGIPCHVGAQGLVDHSTQPGIIGNIASPLLGRYSQLTNDFREYLAPLGILASLAVLDICPFTVASHD
jgi:hypothetical protein